MTTPHDKALEPCPFCGGEAKQQTPEAPHGGMVQCTSCGAAAFGPKWNRRSAPPIDGWVSVTDKLPGEQGCDSEEVLCFLSGHCELHDMECRKGAGWGIRLGFYDAERFSFRCGGRPTTEVTHWRPLPAPPSLLSEDTEGGA